MNAKLTIAFEDGTSKVIELEAAIEAAHDGLQSVEFRETRKGTWFLYFTKRTFEGRRVEGISMAKNDPHELFSR